MTNPFDSDTDPFLVLIDREGEHSLWPTFAEVPRGWEVVHGPDDRGACLEYVRARWTDHRPRRLSERPAVPADRIEG